jgi:xylitol oxidase
MQTNWMGNVTFTRAAALAPSSIEELQHCVAAAVPPLRVLGAGHSFTPLCDCDQDGTSLSLSNMRRVWDLRTNEESSSVSCEGGPQHPLIIQFYR